MAYNNNIMFIRYQLLARLVKMWKEKRVIGKSRPAACGTASTQAKTVGALLRV